LVGGALARFGHSLAREKICYPEKVDLGGMILPLDFRNFWIEVHRIFSPNAEGTAVNQVHNIFIRSGNIRPQTLKSFKIELNFLHVFGL